MSGGGTDKLLQWRRGIAVVAMVVVLLIIDLVVIAIVIGGARDHDLTVARMETIEAFYAAEAGMEMCMRELIEEDDEDGDGATGSISHETPTNNEANDPAFATAKTLPLHEPGRQHAPRRTIPHSAGPSGYTLAAEWCPSRALRKPASQTPRTQQDAKPAFLAAC